MNVHGSKVLLTGANGGIGRTFVDELLRRRVAKLCAGVAASMASRCRMIRAWS
jgi:thioester reductase-like protein